MYLKEYSYNDIFFTVIDKLANEMNISSLSESEKGSLKPESFECNLKTKLFAELIAVASKYIDI